MDRLVLLTENMNIVFVGVECENYAIQLFSSILKKEGHKVNLIFDPRLFLTDEVSNSVLAKVFDIRKQNVNKISGLNPDLVGFSVYTQDYQWSLSMARMIKQELDVPIIFGGIHPTLCPEQVINEDCVDIVCVGEGEEALLELTSHPRLDIKNLWFKSKTNPPRPLISDLDSLPFIDREILYQQKPLFKKGYTISTGRGCPYQCTFCASTALGAFYRKNQLGKYVRQRSVTNVMAELQTAKREHNPRTVYFTDDVFTLSTDWLRQFAFEYKHSVGLPFYCTANPGTIKDEELYLLKEAGCQMIGFGMQSCNEETRKTLLKRTGKNNRIREVSCLCKYLGINFSFDHIFQLPTEPIDNQIEAIEFYNDTRPDVINTFNMTYLPKIELNRFLDYNTQEEVDSGKARTAMFDKANDSFASLFCVIPLLHSKLVKLLIKYKAFKWFRLPFWIRLLLKDIRRAQIGRWSDILFPIQLLITNMKDNLWIKIKFR